MTMQCARLLMAAIAGAVVLGVSLPREGLAQPAPAVHATRLAQNPLITVNTSASLGGNVNGSTVIRVPDWVERPLGRYYMYFANHMGQFIRLAYADAATGPWKMYEPGVLPVRDPFVFDEGGRTLLFYATCGEQ